MSRRELRGETAKKPSGRRRERQEGPGAPRDEWGGRALARGRTALARSRALAGGSNLPRRDSDEETMKLLVQAQQALDVAEEAVGFSLAKHPLLQQRRAVLVV